MLEERVSNHRHQHMTMKAVPRPSLEVVEPEFLLQLLMGLLANPSCLDRGSKAGEVHPGAQVGEIVFLLSRRAVLADQPSLVPWKMLLPLVPYPLGRTVGSTHTDGGKPGCRPLVPLRQLTVLHCALANMSSAAVDRLSGTCRLRGRPRTLVTGQMSCTPTGYTLR